MTGTFERSCAHWSEARRSGMERFYALAHVDYAHLAQSRDWGAWLAAKERAKGGPLRLLDVACGSGKFPTALQRQPGLGEAGLQRIGYDLLDPSAFSLDEAAAALAPPFEAGARFETTLQDFRPSTDAYDVVWATHALYALPAAELREGLTRFVEAIAPGGAGIIAHARASSHYIRFYDAYLGGPGAGAGEPYLAAEAIEETLSAMGVPFETETLSYANHAEDGHEEDVEGYLQRCLFDDSMNLAQMQQDAALGPYLRGCRSDGGWRFEQHVALLSLSC